MKEIKKNKSSVFLIEKRNQERGKVEDFTLISSQKLLYHNIFDFDINIVFSEELQEYKLLFLSDKETVFMEKQADLVFKSDDEEFVAFLTEDESCLPAVVYYKSKNLSFVEALNYDQYIINTTSMSFFYLEELITFSVINRVLEVELDKKEAENLVGYQTGMGFKIEEDEEIYLRLQYFNYLEKKWQNREDIYVISSKLTDRSAYLATDEDDLLHFFVKKDFAEDVYMDISPILFWEDYKNYDDNDDDNDDGNDGNDDDAEGAYYPINFLQVFLVPCKSKINEDNVIINYCIDEVHLQLCEKLSNLHISKNKCEIFLKDENKTLIFYMQGNTLVKELK